MKIYKIDTFDLKEIEYNIILDYWETTNHFNDPHKKIKRHVNTLGHFESDFDNPPFKSFGLYEDVRLIGVTQIVLWNKDWVRYRTLNILKKNRGQKLGIRLLLLSQLLSWPNHCIFGWTRLSHIKWSYQFGFAEIDGIIDNNHTGLILDNLKIQKLRKELL